jgi:signal transduction histidine kinase
MEERRLARSDVVDLAVSVAAAVGLAAITGRVDSDSGDRALDALAYGCVVLAGLSAAVWRRWPAATLVVATVTVSLYAARDYPGGPVFAMPLLGVYAVAASRPRRRSVPLCATAVAVLVLAGWFFDPSDNGSGQWLLLVAWAVVALLLGEAARGRSAYLAGLEERARWLEDSRDEEARRRAAEERLRVARDVHDVVAHALASIALQAGVGVRLANTRPDRARDALVGIRRASREALSELRVTLQLVRSDGPERHARAPTLAGIDQLADEARAGGLAVHLEVCGNRRVLPAAIEMTAYRIVQESLTNVVRHAQAEVATVRLAFHDDRLDLEVTDDGRTEAGTDRNDGHGIRGMRERVAGVGGRLEAGPAPSGGFRVWARLPDRSVV